MLVRLDGLVGITLTTLTTRLVIKPNKFGTLKSEQFLKQSWVSNQITHVLWATICGFFAVWMRPKTARRRSLCFFPNATHVALALLVEAHQVGENRE